MSSTSDMATDLGVRVHPDAVTTMRWDHFVGMLILMASTVSFWLLVLRRAERGKRK